MEKLLESEHYIDTRDNAALDVLINRRDLLASEAREGLEKKYFFDRGNNQVRNREKDRKHIIGVLTGDSPYFSSEMANYIVENLNRYADTEKTLSSEGARALREHWSEIEKRTSYGDASLLAAKRYTIRQNIRNEQVEAAKSKEADRAYIAKGLTKGDEDLSSEMADDIVKNLNRYADTGKTLSREGYMTLRANWEQVAARTSLLESEEFVDARRYLVRQSEILNSNMEKSHSGYAGETSSQSRMAKKKSRLSRILSGVKKKFLEATSRTWGLLENFPCNFSGAKA